MYQFRYQPTPKNILLDLMGVNSNNQLTTPELQPISEAFNLSINNLRVTLNRLVSAGLVSNAERGSYRLTAKALQKRRFINRWRDDRLMRPDWDGSWVGCHLPKGADRTERSSSLRALQWYGFKPGLEQLWIRPDNLTPGSAELHSGLRKLGLEALSHCFVITEIETTLAKQWCSLWDVRTLDNHYLELLDALSRSLDNLAKQPRKNSLAETWRLGGEAIHLLATDPLLPQQIRPGHCYENLKNTMKRYDVVGRSLWLKQLRQPRVETERGIA